MIDSVCFGILISVCVPSHGAAAEATKPPIVVVHKGCPNLREFSKEEQIAIAADRRTVQAATKKALDDWLSMRDQTRKCRGK